MAKKKQLHTMMAPYKDHPPQLKLMLAMGKKETNRRYGLGSWEKAMQKVDEWNNSEIVPYARVD